MIAKLTELVTSGRWRWEDNPGSLTLTGLRVDGASPEGRAVRWTTEWSETAGRVVRVEHYSRPPDGGPDLPDVTDAATCGCLRRAVSRAWGGEAWAEAVPSHAGSGDNPPFGWGVRLWLHCESNARNVGRRYPRLIGCGLGEGEAYVDALLKAPKVGVSDVG